MSSYQVRFATIRDAPAIAEVELGALRRAMPGLLEDQASVLDKRLVFWREAIAFGEPQVQVAQAAGDDSAAVVGFVGFDRLRDKGTPPTAGEIWALFVAPAQWDHGVGLALWDAAREGLVEEGCTQVTAWLPLANVRTLRFFELAGFKRELSSARVAPVAGVKLQEIRLKRRLA